MLARIGVRLGAQDWLGLIYQDSYELFTSGMVVSDPPLDVLETPNLLLSLLDCGSHRRVQGFELQLQSRNGFGGSSEAKNTSVRLGQAKCQEDPSVCKMSSDTRALADGGIEGLGNRCPENFDMLRTRSRNIILLNQEQTRYRMVPREGLAMLNTDPETLSSTDTARQGRGAMSSSAIRYQGPISLGQVLRMACAASSTARIAHQGGFLTNNKENVGSPTATSRRKRARLGNRIWPLQVHLAPDAGKRCNWPIIQTAHGMTIHSPQCLCTSLLRLRPATREHIPNHTNFELQQNYLQGKKTYTAKLHLFSYSHHFTALFAFLSYRNYRPFFGTSIPDFYISRPARIFVCVQAVARSIRILSQDLRAFLRRRSLVLSIPSTGFLPALREPQEISHSS
ncbi:uncharacterized protein BDR25DRAFT_359196 [Lindgomyces ingoldianus]|uniref:Uncharacterized protein n=1 Tax=Lindgomyces ingoldianus TaxID=673940 RepID=A0ACB6QJH6_9PLEO|nr:uncharacterized protein BDR25DRAFT_359196 [Lindgomyces ingoldianus]KAF2466675.1 hypothetical protein BDR25DRAFT_359196 [Lindgomyces ingoldianus]